MRVLQALVEVRPDKRVINPSSSLGTHFMKSEGHSFRH